MAGFYMDFVKRPCVATTRYGLKRALFHCWSHESDGVVAIVEIENGYVDKVPPNKIKFLDHGIFDEYNFTERAAKDDGH